MGDTRPGEKQDFNPQPDPPGNVDPESGAAREADPGEEPPTDDGVVIEF